MMRKYHKINIFLFLYFSFISTEIPEPYKSIKDIPYSNPFRWFGLANEEKLKEFIINYKPKVVVELGTWLGTSAFFMAGFMTEDSKLYAIDTWLGSEEHHKDVAFKKLLPNLYHQFLSNVKSLGLCQRIIPVRMTTIEASNSLDVKADLIYVDASHDENDVYVDIKNWFNKLNSNGIICGDDWEFPGVDRAVIKAANELRQTLYHKSNFWWFSPKK